MPRKEKIHILYVKKEAAEEEFRGEENFGGGKNYAYKGWKIKVSS